ncbi:hypothetical protein BDA96_01G071300 [Sorghum bicolor]|jgi:hypothetical protein|uniref:Uncharacterized protein n=2 Tax=Sorghum bicolor TaxID=4558 RepID=A0A921RX68_SORBI|nr:hypothetical protein BDA96_01G071300 [Sorghum bicolor]KXG37434.1 hypothetical protein SORBI_3001G068800 [Sorghum bicolor]
MRLVTSQFTGESKEIHQEEAMEQKQKLSPLLLVGFIVILCAGPGHAMRLLNDANSGLEFSFGSKAATAGAETEPLDPSLGDDYETENEISHVEFEPEVGSAAPYSYAMAAAPVPVPAVTVASTAAAGPATEPVRARNAGTAAGSRSMKWWLPPSTMPSFPLFPNPGGMPAIPGLPLPVPGMPFHPIGGWAAPAPPAPSQPAPPATEAANTNANNDPNANGGGVN